MSDDEGMGGVGGVRATLGNGKSSPPPMSFLPPGLQQMQQLIQSQLASGFSPQQLQHFMQQHTLMSQHQVGGD